MQKIYVIGKLLDIVHVTIVPLAHKCAAGFYAQVFLSDHFSNSNGYKKGSRGSQISPNIINIKGTDELGSYLSLKCPQNVFTLMDIGHIYTSFCHQPKIEICPILNISRLKNDFVKKYCSKNSQVVHTIFII